MFEKGSQVFFPYAKASNKYLLQQYGFCLENNPYNYLEMAVEYLPHLGKYKALTRQRCFWKDTARIKTFIVRRTKFNVNLLYYVRMVHVDMSTFNAYKFFTLTASDFEISCLKLLRGMYEEFLGTHFSETQQENEQQITNQQLSYHAYFAAIYRTERQRIIHNQINLINVMVKILEKMLQSKVSLLQALKDPVPGLETEDNYLTNRLMLKPLLQRFFE